MKSTRQEAKAAGDRFYNNSNPCCHGHYGARYTNSALCVVCVKAAAKKVYASKMSTRDEIIFPRKVAIEAGNKYYRSRRNCINGHKNPLRRTNNSTCIECIDSKRVRKVHRDVIITKEENKAEAFKLMVERVYDRGQTW